MGEYPTAGGGEPYFVAGPAARLLLRAVNSRTGIMSYMPCSGISISPLLMA